MEKINKKTKIFAWREEEIYFSRKKIKRFKVDSRIGRMNFEACNSCSNKDEFNEECLCTDSQFLSGLGIGNYYIYCGNYRKSGQKIRRAT